MEPPKKRARTSSITVIPDGLTAEEVEARFVQLLEQHPEGVKEDLLKRELSDIDLTQRASTINSLLSRGRLTLGKIGDSIVYKLLATEDAAKLRGLDPNEVILYRMIEKEQHKGIWIRDLRRRSNLQQGKLQKLLKSLTSRKLIKSVKSVQRKQKVLMLYELEPAEELTGGAWYHGSEFDEQCVQILRETCHKYIKQRQSGTAEELHEFVRKSGIAKVNLALKDIYAILLSLTYDGILEEAPKKMEIGYNDPATSSSRSSVSSSVASTTLYTTPYRCCACASWFVFVRVCALSQGSIS
mmetsp:Transcript_47678/g.93701  ORF Transcript_47678/g.93701 Transcript_47678/m.93701 type:complete len:298 (+) Transcript_47678:119-1012(+)